MNRRLYLQREPKLNTLTTVSPAGHSDQQLMCRHFVLGQIGDIKTAERYFQDVEKADRKSTV